jgi:hypothetical protein
MRDSVAWIDVDGRSEAKAQRKDELGTQETSKRNLPEFLSS